MGKRGRRLINKFKGAKNAIEIKKKATKEQFSKIKKGVSSYTDMAVKMKEYKKLYKKTNDKIYYDKYTRIKEIISKLKTMKIDEAKKLGLEYDKLYPDEFND